MKEAKIFRNIKSPSRKFLSLRIQFDLLLTFVSCFIKERKFNCRWFTLSLVVSSWSSNVHIIKNAIMRLSIERNWMTSPFLFTKRNFVRSFLISPHHPTLWGNVKLANLWLNFYWVIAKCFSFFPFCQRWILSKSRKTITNKFSWQLENRRLCDIFSDTFVAARLLLGF